MGREAIMGDRNERPGCFLTVALVVAAIVALAI
jgi:hypothetical protein